MVKGAMVILSLLRVDLNLQICLCTDLFYSDNHISVKKECFLLTYDFFGTCLNLFKSHHYKQSKLFSKICHILLI